MQPIDGKLDNAALFEEPLKISGANNLGKDVPLPQYSNEPAAHADIERIYKTAITSTPFAGERSV